MTPCELASGADPVGYAASAKRHLGTVNVVREAPDVPKRKNAAGMSLGDDIPSTAVCLEWDVKITRLESICYTG